MVQHLKFCGRTTSAVRQAKFSFFNRLKSFLPFHVIVDNYVPK